MNASSFFFQAEDGIRDVAVTGVQTCALPICDEQVAQPPEVDELHRAEAEQPSEGDARGLGHVHYRGEQIGRASRRERVWVGGVSVAWEETSCAARAAAGRGWDARRGSWGGRG